MTGTGKHRPRDQPYPDELDQLFCEECETLCMDGRPCMCCWDGVLSSGRRSPEAEANLAQQLAGGNSP